MTRDPGRHHPDIVSLMPYHVFTACRGLWCNIWAHQCGARHGPEQAVSMGFLVELFRNQILDPGKLGLFLLLTAFVVSFLFIRLSVRMIGAGVTWWPGNVSTDGLHIHHVVFGLVFMLVGGVLAFAPVGWSSPWWETMAALFGIGAALVLDEFALILHLDDVYWSERGRLSVDAVALGAALIGVQLLGALPLGAEASSADQQLLGRWPVIVTIVLNGCLVLLALLKGRLWLGVLGVLLPPLALVGAVRLGRPDSLFGRRRYPPGSRKSVSATARTHRYVARWVRIKYQIFDAIAGRPDAPSTVLADAPSAVLAAHVTEHPAVVLAEAPKPALSTEVGARPQDEVVQVQSARSPDARALLVSVWASVAFAVVSLAWGLTLGSQLIVFDGLYSFVGVGLSLLAVLALRTTRKGSDERYPWGREVWEPLTIMVKAVALGGLCVYALFAAVAEILRGGQEVAAGWAVLYAVVATAAGFAISAYLRRHSGQGSDLVRAEAAEWTGDTLLSLGVLGGFLVALLLEMAGRGDLARYVDPALVVVVSAAFLRVPARLLAEGMREVLTMSPRQAIQQELQACLREVEADYGFTESFLRTSKVGSRLDVEIDFVVDEASKAQPVQWFDAVRQDLQDRLRALGHAPSMTVSFTADRKWALSTPVEERHR